MDKKAAFLPLLLMTFGVGWLLTSLGIAPRVDWVWTLGIGGVGLLTLAFGGLNKFTVVVGPFLILSSAFAFLRQFGMLQFEVEAPLLVIIFGALLLVAQMPAISVPNWIVKDTPANQKIKDKIFK
jgi:hypothetical protein